MTKARAGDTPLKFVRLLTLFAVVYASSGVSHGSQIIITWRIVPRLDLIKHICAVVTNVIIKTDYA